jgi:tetratricopeptide (TPR) repeat protein
MAYYNRGLAWYQFDEYDKALADYTSALDKEDLPASQLPLLHNSLGNVLLMKDRHADSIRAYSKAIALDSGNVSYYTNRAEAHEYDGNDDLAADDYTRAIALEPGNADLYMSRCAAQIRCKRFLAALADFWRGMRIKFRE